MKVEVTNRASGRKTAFFEAGHPTNPHATTLGCAKLVEYHSSAFK